jgi:hypothetical protein
LRCRYTPKYEIHAQHGADVAERRAGHDDRNGWSPSTGIIGHVAPAYPSNRLQAI